MRRPLPTAEEAREILQRRRSRPARRPPNPAGRALSPLLKSLETRFGQGPSALQAHWHEIAGTPLFAHTEPVRLIRSRLGGGATLELKVDGPIAALVQHRAPQILQRLEAVMGAGTVTKLRIIQGPVRRSDAASTGVRLPRRRPGPLEAAQEQALQDSLRDQPDGPLKAALIALGRGVLGRKP